ncbi:HK97 family phage prohead protease [Streptomyces parvus]|uniref:HK97 family phage prohead protease n=1 Tax=Streptomyces parvus TaxID=66428 RepID=UPI003408334D
MPRTPPPNAPLRRPPQGKGIVRAIYAVTGVLDDVKDLIVPGTFTRTLAHRRVKVVWHHEWKDPVGTVLDIEEWLPGDPRFASIPGGIVWPREAGALVATVQYNLRTTRGRDTYEQVKQWHENGEAQFSIGYKVTPGGASKRHDSVRIIHDLDLYEISPVLHGAHPMTRSLEVKAAHRLSEGELEHKATWSTVEIKAPEKQTGRGVMVALTLPADVAASIAHPEGTAPADLHITLAYLGDAETLGGHPDDLRDIVSSAVGGLGPVNGTIGGIGQFPDAGDGVPTWVPVDVPGLAELRHRVVEALDTSVYAEQVRANHGFTPHITLGYNLPDTKPIPPQPVVFDRLAVVLGPDTSYVPLDETSADAPQAPTPPHMEAKTAMRIVMEAKAHPSGGPGTVHQPEQKSAARIVLEAKSALPLTVPTEVPLTTPMPFSYEQLRDRLVDAARTLLSTDGDECYVAVEATYPDRVIVSRNSRNGTDTYAIPYTAVDKDVSLGVPAPVELTTVALPVAGGTHAVEGDEATDARFVKPTAAALRDATSLIEVSDAGPSHLQHLKPAISELLNTLAKKGLPMDDAHAAPPGSSLNLWDSDYDVKDGWDDEDEETPGPPPDAAPPEASEGEPEEDMPTDIETAPVGQVMPDDEEEEVRLDAEEVKAALASLAP